MKKEIANKLCGFCESEYKLSFSPDDASGYPKFCPFCGNENEVEFDEEEQEEE